MYWFNGEFLHLALLLACNCNGQDDRCSYPSHIPNWDTPYPKIDLDGTGRLSSGTFLTALFYGFSNAMLGVSGFETSSQFVEEQAPGVFVKTLKNMWIGVIIL